jgi:mutator protein MutT
MKKREVAAIFIQNSKGDFFVHQRAAHKKTFPNRYGIGAGGHVEPGESPTEAAQRELKEETGLETPVVYHFTLEFDEPDFQQTSHLFTVETDDSFRSDESEWQWSGWLTKEELDVLSQDGKLCTDTDAMYKKLLSTIR